MKKTIILPLIILLLGCNTTPKDASQIDLKDFKQRISYALGADIGANFQNIPKEIFGQLKKEDIEKGFKDFLLADKSLDESEKILSAALSNPSGIDTSKYKLDKISYSYGALFGQMLRHSIVSKKAKDRVNNDIIEIGFQNALVGSDSLIAKDERKKMIVDFNNDLNKLAGESYMDSIKAKYPDAVQKEGYVIVEDKKGNGDPIDLKNEFKILLSVENISGDTIISTYKYNAPSEDANSEIVNTAMAILPPAWQKAANFMVVGGEYTIYAPYKLGFGEKGLQSPTPPYNYVIQPFQTLIIHTKVLSQAPLNSAVKEAGKKVIEAAKKKPNTYVDPSGYILTTLRKGDGEKVQKGADVQAQYILTNAEGQVVENSYMISQRTNRPAPSFSLNNVVKGWKLALQKMQVGGHYILVLPYDLAYGERGNRGIGPFETLTFDISILRTGPAGTLVQAQSPTTNGNFSQADLDRLQKQLQEQQGK